MCFCLLCFSFDEVYYGQFVSLYMKRIFFVDDSGPPFGHMLLALGGRVPPETENSLLPVALEERSAG